MRLILPLALLFACSGGEPPLCTEGTVQCSNDEVQRCEDEVWVVETVCGADEACAEVDDGAECFGVPDGAT